VNFERLFLEKIERKSFGRYFSEKNAPNAQKIMPKWQNVAKAGHTSH
jgi:hypothetical protein